MQVGQTKTLIEFWENVVALCIKWIREGLDSWDLTAGGPQGEKILLRDFTILFVKDQRDWGKIPPEEHDGIRLAAKFLVFDLTPGLIRTIYKLLMEACFYEGNILIRSLDEALELLEYLGGDRCTDEKAWLWVKGKTIMSRETRKGSKYIFFGGRRYIEKEMDDVEKRIVKDYFGKEKTLTELIKSKIYAIDSHYTHFSASALIKNLDAQQHKYAFERFNNSLIRAMEDFWIFFPEFISQERQAEIQEFIDEVRSVLVDKTQDLSDLLSEHYVKRCNKSMLIH